MNERMRFDRAEAAEAGRHDARALLQALANIENGNSPANLMGYFLDDILSLALNQRLEECQERKAAFCTVIAPILADAVDHRNSVSMELIVDSEGGEL